MVEANVGACVTLPTINRSQFNVNKHNCENLCVCVYWGAPLCVCTMNLNLKAAQLPISCLSHSRDASSQQLPATLLDTDWIGGCMKASALVLPM